MLPEGKLYKFSFVIQKISTLLCYTVAREELLTEHAIQWNKRKVESQAVLLTKRYKKVRSSLILLQSNFSDY